MATYLLTYYDSRTNAPATYERKAHVALRFCMELHSHTHTHTHTHTKDTHTQKTNDKRRRAHSSFVRRILLHVLIPFDPRDRYDFGGRRRVAVVVVRGLRLDRQ